MTCALPPELNDRELLVYLDDEASHEVVAHVEGCSHCRERARRLARLQGRLTAELYRVRCPSPLELGEYHLGVLNRDQEVAVAGHLVECPHCSREMAQMKGYLGDLSADLELSPVEKIRVWVAELVGGGEGVGRPGAPTLAPALAGLRGAEEGPRIYQAGDVQIVIEIQDDAIQQGQKMLLGLIMGPTSGDLVAHLWRGGEPVAEVAVDEMGNLVIGDLAPGSYELVLRGSEAEIQIQDLKVGAS